MSDRFHQSQRKIPQRRTLKALFYSLGPTRTQPSPGVPLLASLGSGAGAAGRGCFGIWPWDAALLVPTPKLQATGSQLGADATHCNCSLAALWGAHLQTVPRYKHCFQGEGRGGSRWTPLFSALAWEQCIARGDAGSNPPLKMSTSRVWRGPLSWGCQAGLSQKLCQQAKHRLLGPPGDRYGVLWLWENESRAKGWAGGDEGGCCPGASSQQAEIHQV